MSLGDKIATLAAELQIQNGFLSKHLISDEAYQSADYRRSMFVKAIVANERASLRNRAVRERGTSEDGSSTA